MDEDPHRLYISIDNFRLTLPPSFRLNLTSCALLPPTFIQIASSVERYSSVDMGAMADDGLFIPDWVLDVRALEDSQVGGVTSTMLQSKACIDLNQISHWPCYSGSGSLTGLINLDMQVRSGGLAARVATEGVMLQYAVDTHLDELLAALWLQVS